MVSNWPLSFSNKNGDDRSVTLSIIFVVFVFGLLFGSFGGMSVYRIPRELPLGMFKKTRSFCPSCKKKISFYDNIPVLSYFFLLGKCRHCKKPISIKYPLVELCVAASFAFVCWAYHWTPQLEWPEQLMFFTDVYFFWSLVVLTFIDLEFRIIPDRFSIGNWVLALVVAVILHFAREYPLMDAVLGGAAGFGVFFLIGFFYEKVKGIEGLGFGDVKMMGWLGTWLGLAGVPILVLVGSITGLFVGVIVMIKEKGNLKTAIPFGPFLALGAITVWVLQRFKFFPFDALH